MLVEEEEDISVIYQTYISQKINIYWHKCSKSEEEKVARSCIIGHYGYKIGWGKRILSDSLGGWSLVVGDYI